MTEAPPPDLKSSIQRLKSLARNLSSQPPKHIAELYVASVGLLCHLKTDQGTLHRCSGDNASCPPPDKIPAITAVIQDEKLFRALLQCLRSTTAPAGGDASDATSLSASSVGRKRSISMSSETDWVSSKAMKMTNSPVPGARQKLKLDHHQQRKPTFHVQSLAATILYTAFQHLDHWPAPMVKAYAEDVFGPRLWVDDPRCRLLVENLALAHAVDCERGTREQRQEAVTVADAYRKSESLLASPATEENSVSSDQRGSPTRKLPVQQQQIRRGSETSLISAESAVKRSKVGKKAATSDAAVASRTGKLTSKKREDNGDSSSSGEEDEEVMVTTESSSAKTASSPSGKPKDIEFYPFRQKTLNLTQVRQRFFGVNLESAHEYIALSLSSRLDVKSKQNSGLLQSLPLFTSIAAVRRLIAANLEKWLQSPALAGLARTLFSSTVNHMENSDPPVEDDLKAIDSILAMRLKANQLNAHIENVTAIAKRIPSASVAHHMYSRLLSDVLTVIEAPGGIMDSDHLKMIGAIHRAISSSFSYDAMAAALLMMLVKPGDPANTGNMKRVERDRLVKKLRSVIRCIAMELGENFDGCALMDSLFSFDVSAASWTTRDEEDKARLMFQCVTLCASFASKATAKNRNHQRHQHVNENAQLSPSAKQSLRRSLRSARKLMLTWCCTDYGPRFTTKLQRKLNGTKGGDDATGPGPPDYASILLRQKEEERIPSWMNTMRCLLFLEVPDSSHMKNFFVPGGSMVEDEEAWQEELERIKCCSSCGADLDDEMLWIVLKASSLPEGGICPDMGIQMLEHLFECCANDRSGSLSISDPMLVWELYNLAQYSPVSRISNRDNPNEAQPHENSLINGESTGDTPRLAYPGLWWRVTMMALIMCGASTQKIGAVAWKEHPTLRALMKMVTSSRYRFPTVDSDEACRDQMKKAEQAARDEETRIAERLFLPPKREKKKLKRLGSRVSRRLKKQQEEKEAAKMAAEASRRRKLLKAAQKSIMLWHPVGPARKPPREAAELLVAVEKLFGLSEIYQRSVDPDILLMTVGETTRGAIERAYDWLIPIISRLPETIGRLPSNTSCFLLLRAYGADGDERNQLKELAAPLLRHVKDSLRGQFGESDSVTAFDLLMGDVASQNPDRRRCARRVLQDALAEVAGSNTDTKSSWMLNILRVRHAKALVPCAIGHVSKAATFERGRVLRSLSMALEQYIAFAEKNGIETESFPSMLVHLISGRPSVFAEAMDAFADLRSLAIRVVYGEFSRCKDNITIEDPCDVVVIKLRGKAFGADDPVQLSLPLLETACVLLSIWRHEKDIDGSDADVKTVDELVDALMIQSSSDKGVETREESDDIGLASAKMLESNTTAIMVESWIILAKAHSDSIARRAALSAPAGFLPRLLLCSGLPKGALLTMVDRLGRLGDAVKDKGKYFVQLLVPSAASEWDIARVGFKRDVARRLLGRLSAFMRLNDVRIERGQPDVSLTFLEWLSQECKSQEKKPKKKQKKAKVALNSSLLSVSAASSILSSVREEKLAGVPQTAALDADDPMCEFLTALSAPDAIGGPSDTTVDQSVIDAALKQNLFEKLDGWLGSLHAKKYIDSCSGEQVDPVEVAIHLLRGYMDTPHVTEGLTLVVLKWIPILSRSAGKEALWKLIFADKAKPAPLSSMLRGLLTGCLSSWSELHVSSCTEWIVSGRGETTNDEYSLERMNLFLVHTSGQRSFQMEGMSDVSRTGAEGDSWGQSERFVSAAANVAVALLKNTAQTDRYGFCGRNSLPSCLTLLLLLARCGRNQMRHVSQRVLRELTSSPTDDERYVLEAVFLRLYICFPQWMNLGTVAGRTCLMEASETHAASWTAWRSSLDDQLEIMLRATTSGDMRVARAMSDRSRKHPLLILRQLGDMMRFLERDATARAKSESEPRGLVQGQSLAGPREIKLSGKIVKVTVRHWGFCYTEPVWVALLDVVAVIPREVLFTCGRRLGVLPFLSLYLLLVSVQLELRTADKTGRLKSKLSDLFSAFKQTNSAGWREWLDCNIGKKEVRHLLVSCDFLTPQEAIDSLKGR